MVSSLFIDKRKEEVDLGSGKGREVEMALYALSCFRMLGETFRQEACCFT